MSTIRFTHLAVVTDVEDPEQRGRIKVACASLMGMDDSDEPREYPNWVEPSIGYRTSSANPDEDGEGGVCGFFGVPGVGTTVELEITEGSTFDQSPGQSGIGAPDPRYKGCLINAGESIGGDFTTNYPNRFGWKGANGSVFVFDVTEGDEKITIQSHDLGDGRRSFFLIDKSGSMYMATHTGTLIVLDAKTDTIKMIDGHGNVLQTTGGGFSFISNAGPVVMADGKNVSIMTPGQVMLNASHVEVSAGSVNLGANAVESVIKGNTFQALFNTHVHTGNLGAPTLPPLVLLTGAELSLVVTTE